MNVFFAGRNIFKDSADSSAEYVNMNDSPPLYNSRITKIYVQYLSKYYPDIDLDSVLDEAGIARYEIEDPAHWFSQEKHGSAA